MQKSKKNKNKITTTKELNCNDDDTSYTGYKLLDSTKHMGFEMTLPGMKKPLKPIPVFQQMPGEKKKQFFRRMDNTVKAVMKRKQYEEKFDVDVTDDPSTGKTNVQDREKDEVELEMEKIKNKKKAKKGIVVKTKEEKRQIRRDKDKERKRKKKGLNIKENNVLDFDSAQFTDSVKFNEVVHAPPENLMKVQNFSERNSAQKNNLLLSKKLTNSKPMNNNNKVKSNKNSISLARKSMLEQERKRVIEEYRKTKIKK